jgi:galactokinase
MIGHGFGGSTVSLAASEAIDEYTDRLSDYERIFGFHPETFLCEAVGGVRRLEPSPA